MHLLSKFCLNQGATEFEGVHQGDDDDDLSEQQQHNMVLNINITNFCIYLSTC